MTTAVIVQARVGSTRLPEKMIRPFYGDMGLLEYLLRRLVNASLGAPIILAIPESGENDVLAEVGRKVGVKVGRGSEEDVLLRFIEVAEEYDCNRMIRVCADNPFLDIGYLKRTIVDFPASGTDYYSFKLKDGTPTIRSHFGFWAEGITLEALKKSSELTEESVYREHVTNFIYTHPEKFKIRLSPIPPEIEKHSWVRLTIDTAADFENLKRLAEGFPPENDFDALEIVNAAIDRPELRESMRREIEKNQK